MKRFSRVFSLTPGAHAHPDRGIRIAILLFLPLLLLKGFGPTPPGQAIALGVLLGILFTSFCDSGPSFRLRARLMGIFIPLGALAVMAASLVGIAWWEVLPAIFVIAFITSMLPLFGLIPTMLGGLLSVLFLSTLSDSGLSAGLALALGFLIGGVSVLALAAVFASVSWKCSAAAPETPLPAGKTSPLSLHALLAECTLTSPLFRYALIRTIGIVSVAGIAWGFQVPHPAWAPITVMICVRQEKAASILAASQYIIGSVLGAALADVFVLHVHNPLMIVLLIIAITCIVFTIKDLNMALRVFAMTNLTLLLMSLAEPGVSHLQLRIFATLIGGAVALVVTLLAAELARQNTSHPSPESSSPNGLTY